MRDEFDILLVNVLSAARWSGFSRGRQSTDEDAANAAEDEATHALRLKLAALLDEREALRAALKEIEWMVDPRDRSDEPRWCPACDQYEADGAT